MPVGSDPPRARGGSTACVEVEGARLELLLAREGEQAADQFGPALAGVHRLIAERADVLGQTFGFEQQFEIAENDREKVVEVVGDAPGELADRLHPLRAAQPVLGRPALGQIVDDPDENRLDFGIAAADRQIDREDRAVLALGEHLAADADDLRVSGLLVIVQILIVVLGINRRHQHFDIFADDLVRTITKQPFACGVEGADRSVGVDQNDAIDRGIEHCLQADAVVGLFNRDWG
ncbi:MAG TPA: hypothetical protein VKC17_04080 [Sphingomicrobium sp.]|nr:hypothetical protein [Sphingomicrobium sp.]